MAERLCCIDINRQQISPTKVGYKGVTNKCGLPFNGCKRQLSTI